MKTAKQILSENRDSAISSIKYIFKVYKKEEIKKIMWELLEYCEGDGSELILNPTKTVKNGIKTAVQKLKIRQSQPKKRIKLEDAIAGLEELNDEKFTTYAAASSWPKK